MVFFALAEMLPTSATRIHLRWYCFKWNVEFFGVLKGARHLGFSEKVCLNSKFFKEKIHHRGNKLVHHHRLKAKVEIAVKRNFLFSLKIASLSDGLPVRRR